MSSALGTGINEGGGSSSLYMQYPHQRAFGLLHDPGAVIARAGPAPCDSSVASCDQHGADRAFSGEGVNRLFGGDGNDTLTGGLSKDTFKCGAGRDTAIATRKDKVARDCESVVRP